MTHFKKYQPVESVEHLNGDEDREGHRHGMGIRENGAVHPCEFGGVLVASEMVSQLVVVEAGAVRSCHEPPTGGTHSGCTDVTW